MKNVHPLHHRPSTSDVMLPLDVSPAPTVKNPKVSSPVKYNKSDRELNYGLSLPRRQGRQLRRADRPYDRLIDLHGMTQQQAHQALTRFLHQARTRGDRCVLIITGKGGMGGGILRREVPRWLNEPDLRSGILAFDYAAPKHGGEGALYILLRRK